MLLALSTLLLLAAACGASVTPDTQTTSAPLVSLPADEGPHDSGIEWWYFNGLITDDRGQQYSYHYVTFQTEGAGTAVPHLLQASLGDHTAGKHLTGEQVLLDTLDRGAAGIDVSVNGWRMQGDGESYDLAFGLGKYSLDLVAVSTRPPVLHHGRGLVNLGPAGDTFYYSRTRLAVTGSITIDGQQRPVTGAAWMDHQWGDEISQQVGWDWASVQLDDGSDLMAVMVWDPTDRTPFAAYGTVILPDGTMWDLNENDLSISSSGIWTSSVTGIEYPSGWTLTVPVLDLTLELEPVLLDAEFAGSQYTPAAYWEGEVRVSGTRQGQAVGGRGFVELVGYDPSQLEPSQLEPTPAP
ncbi:MAG: lipocalin family protein [Dehalococcoidia bacterium]